MAKKQVSTEQFSFEALDEKDLAILKVLQLNAKATISDIAKQVHLSGSPVHERIRRMEQQGVIKQYATLLDLNKIQKSLIVICYVSLKEHNKNAGLKFIKRIQELTEVVECYSISGEFDFMLKVIARDMERYYDFHVNKLSQAENVGHIQSVFVMGVVKDTHVVL
ncbi:MAG: Lrp/AsnC family transcriptional regulator [Chitinophagaceae bacterium]|nr:Lrp/AsnC family transcriptional regulator [Chitinophagaceae bacterium]